MDDLASPPTAPDPAASVILLRPASHGIEVLMVERPQRGFFGGIVVFPGGKVDAIDRSGLARKVVTGDQVDQQFRSAALRELAEETGLAVTTDGVARAPRARDEDLFRELDKGGSTLTGDDLVLVSRWVTPELAPRRFDTMFYLLPVTSTPDVLLDADELVDFDWVTATEALHRHEKGIWRMILPTLAHLRWLERRHSIEDALDSAQGADGRTLIEPKVMEDGSLVPIHLPAGLP